MREGVSVTSHGSVGNRLIFAGNPTSFAGTVHHLRCKALLAPSRSAITLLTSVFERFLTFAKLPRRTTPAVSPTGEPFSHMDDEMLKLRIGSLTIAFLIVGILTAGFVCSGFALAGDRVISVQFAGNEKYSSDELEKALRCEADYLLALHPQAETNDIKIATERLLRAGYRNRGFRDIEVSVAPVDEHGIVVCQIIEGPQYERRDVRIDGCTQIDSEKLISRLTQPFPKAEYTPTFRESGGETKTIWLNKEGKESKLSDPVWERGKPATFSNERNLKEKVDEALKDLGFSNAFCIVKIDSDQRTHSADLNVSIIEEGVPDLAQTIKIDGLQSNSLAQILDFLELSPGMIVNRQRITEINRKLWESGRFLRHEVKFDATTKSLSLNFTEVDSVPTVDEPIDEYAKVFMRARDWLTMCGEAGIDMEVDYNSSDDVKLKVIQSLDGALVQISDRRLGTNGSSLTVLAEEDSIIFDLSDHPSVFRVDSAVVDGKLQFSSTLRATKKEGRTVDQVFTFSANTDRKPGEPSVAHHWSISRADFLGIIYKPGLEKQFTETELVIRHEDFEMVVDRESGAIKLWTIGNGQMRFAKGSYRSARQVVGKRFASKPNAFDAQRSTSSLIAYCISEPMVEHLQRASEAAGKPIALPDPLALSASRKLVDSDLLAIPDAIAASFFDANEDGDSEKFVIPSDRPKATDMRSMFIEIGAGKILRLSPKILPEEGWPIKVTREACLIAMGEGKYSGKVLQEMIEDPNSGPLCHATVAYLLGLIGQNHRKTFAARGLSVLNPDQFASDYELLTALTHNDLVMKTIRSVQSLNEQELDAVLAAINNESIGNIVRLAAIHPLDKKRDQSDFWYQITRAKLQPWLEQMAR